MPEAMTTPSELDAQGDTQPECARRDEFDVPCHLVVSPTQDRALAERLLDLGYGRRECFTSFVFHRFSSGSHVSYGTVFAGHIAKGLEEESGNLTTCKELPPALCLAG